MSTMTDNMSLVMALGQQDGLQPPQATVSLCETTLENGTLPSTPQPSSVKIEDDLEQDEKKPAKKRKSWGQELPTPKTNLPPRFVL